MKCFECSQPATVDHHVVPKSRGGEKTIPLCHGCHGKAHHTDMNMSISQLTKEALHDKIKNGECVGKVCFGFNLSDDGRTLLPNLTEQEAIRWMQELRSEGLTLRQIAVALSDCGIATKESGRAWTHSAVAYILKRLQLNLEKLT